MKKTRVKIYASFVNDIGPVIRWLSLNKAISKSGEPYEVKRGGYAIEVLSNIKKKEIAKLVKDKFGTFAKVF